ncbi:hypothetical protein Tco_0472425 [Tanacetum coccineum]
MAATATQLRLPYQDTGFTHSHRDRQTLGDFRSGSRVPNRGSTDSAEQNACSHDNLKLATKEREDSILEEAQIIEAKCKRIAELSATPLPLEGRLKSHWDFILEEVFLHVEYVHILVFGEL